MALKRVAIPSPNYSSRDGNAVRLIVLHTAEGARTYQDLGAYFQGDVGVSSHVGIDDTANTVGEYVQAWNGKAWTAAGANSVAVQAELCAFAKWSSSEWDNHQAMLENTANWVAEEADRFDIPIVELSAQQAQSSGRGVCDHDALGSWGGGHWDCGSGFPMGRVLDMAKGGSSSGGGGSSPTPPPPSSSSSKAPPFPYPSDDYLGRPDGSNDWHDGHGHGADSVNVRKWQERMRGRGWTIDTDGVYGPQSEQVCRSFQGEKGLAVDGKVGPQTWAKTWEAPVT